MEKLPTLSPDLQVSLLSKSLDYLEKPSLPDLYNVPFYILTHYSGELPSAIYSRLMKLPTTTLLKMPEKIRRTGWEENLDIFTAYIDEIVDQYIKDVNVIRTNENMILALDVNSRREKTQALNLAIYAICSSPILYDEFMKYLRKKFAETGNALIGSFVLDLSNKKPHDPLVSVGIRPTFAKLLDTIRQKYSRENKEITLMNNDVPLEQKDKDIVERLLPLIDELYQEFLRLRSGDEGISLSKKKQKLAGLIRQSSVSSHNMLRQSSISSISSHGLLTKQHSYSSTASATGMKTPSEAAEYVIKALKKEKNLVFHFTKPVIEVYPALKDSYLSVIKQPMDLDTMLKKAKDHQYNCLAEVEADFELIFENCKQFNSVSAPLLIQSAQDFLVQARFLVGKIRNQVIGGEEEELMDENILDAEDEEMTGGDDTKKAKVITPVFCDAIISLCDPNLQHSLAKMFWDIIYVKVISEERVPRESPEIAKLIHLLRIGQEAHRIVRDCFLNQNPFDLEGDALVFMNLKQSRDPLLLKPIPLLTCLVFEKDAPSQFVFDESLKDYLKENSLIRELFLRFFCSRLRFGLEEEFCGKLLNTIAEIKIDNHPGFRRTLVIALEKVEGFRSVKRLALDLILIPYLKQLEENNSAGSDAWIDAHEFVSSLLSADHSLKLVTSSQSQEFGDINLMLDFARKALRDMTPSSYLSVQFRKARKNYEVFFAHEAFIGFRDSFNLPALPSIAKLASPGSAKTSPSPGMSQPMSASPFLQSSTSPGSTLHRTGSSIAMKSASPSYMMG